VPVGELILDVPPWNVLVQQGVHFFPSIEESNQHSTIVLERFKNQHLLPPTTAATNNAASSSADLDCRTEGAEKKHPPLVQYIFPLDRNDFNDLQWLLPLNVKQCSIVIEMLGGKLVVVVMKSERCAGCLQNPIDFSCPTCQMVGFCSLKCWTQTHHPKATCDRLMEYSYFHFDRLNMLMEFGEAGCSLRLTNFNPRLMSFF
jgi:hypothetical protein